MDCCKRDRCDCWTDRHRCRAAFQKHKGNDTAQRKINHLVYRMDKDEDELSDFKSKSADKHRLIFDTLGEHQKSLINHRAEFMPSKKIIKRRNNYEKN